MPNQWYKISNKSPEVAEVRIYDEIGGWGITAQKFVEDLNAITAQKITLRINSVGGEVFDGLAICNAIKNHPAEVAVEIDGIAASIASVIACAGDSVCIAKNAFMMIHNVMSGCFGYAEDLRKEADVIDKLSLSVANTYVDRTGKTLQEVQKAMGDESWFDAAEAKAFGLVDSIQEEDPDEEEEDGEESDMSASLVKAALKFKNTPEKVRRFAASLAGKQKTPIKPKENSVAKLNIIEREGKKFVKVGDEEHELVELAAAGSAQNAAPAPQVDVQKAVDAAVAKEREYRTNFMTAMATATLAGDEAKNFEKTFYGRPIDDVKFLASNTIGARAKPIGEGDGDDEKRKKEAAAAAAAGSAANVEQTASKRFADEGNIRKLFGIHINEPADSTTYQAALKRYVAREKQWIADQAAGKHQVQSPASK